MRLLKKGHLLRYKDHFDPRVLYSYAPVQNVLCASHLALFEEP